MENIIKIKILTNIPGYSAGKIEEIRNGKNGILIGYGHSYKVERLLESGWAEEIKYEIDVNSIRSKISNKYTDCAGHPLGSMKVFCRDEEAEWFTSYRIVEAVIKELNGDIMDLYAMTNICFCYITKKLSTIPDGNFRYNILPQCGSVEIAEKVIELCEPELKVLFGII